MGGETARVPSADEQRSKKSFIHLMDLFKLIAVRHSGHCGHSAHAALAELDLHPTDGTVDGLASRRR